MVIMSKSINHRPVHKVFMEYFHIEKAFICLYNVIRLDLDTLISSSAGCFSEMSVALAVTGIRKELIRQLVLNIY